MDLCWQWTIIYQKIGQPRKDGYIPKNIQPTKTDSLRNRKSEPTNNMKEIESVIKNSPTKKNCRSHGFTHEFC